MKQNEYRELVERYGLSELFSKDLFFVISDGVMNIEEIGEKFSDFITEDENLSILFTRLQDKYTPRLQASFEIFKQSKIQDDRYDDNGNYHDLSKSVYRTVRMRGARNLELNLQKYTAIKKIESNSPIDFTFLQFIDPNTLIDLWDKYHLAEYMVDIVKYSVKQAEQAVPLVIASLISDYIRYKRINGNKERKKKREARDSFELEKKQYNEYLERLNSRLVESVLESNQKLQSEVSRLKKQQLNEANKSKMLRDDETLKALSERISNLENIDVKTEIVKNEDKNSQLNLLD